MTTCLPVLREQRRWEPHAFVDALLLATDADALVNEVAAELAAFRAWTDEVMRALVETVGA